MKIIKILMVCFVSVVLASSVLMLAQFYGSDLLDKYIISKASPHLVRLSKNKFFSKGYGTGFYLKSNNNVTYIVTNKHICDMTKKDYIYILEDNKRPVLKRILERWEKEDLCIIEAPVNRGGLPLAKSYSKNEKIFVLGYPDYMPLTFSFGRIVGFDDLEDFSTTVPVLGGNSGSPVLNIWGEVVGVVWGRRTVGAGWAVIVNLDELNKFLAVY